MSIDFATAGPWRAAGGRPHKVGCRCGDSGRCEYAQAVAEEAAERWEMTGRYPCGAFAPHYAVVCPECRQAWGYEPFGEQMSKVEWVRDEVESIREEAMDDEGAHYAEDKLRESVLRMIADGSPDARQLAREALLTTDIEFCRWYA